MVLLKQMICESILDLKSRRSLVKNGDCRTYGIREASLIGGKASGGSMNIAEFMS